MSLSVYMLGDAPAPDYRTRLIDALAAATGGPAQSTAIVNDLEAVVSDAASSAATRVVKPVLIGSIVGTVVTLVGTWWLTRRRG